MAEASAPGKLILFGEHAVVYGRPAIAVPVHQVQARAQVTAGPPGQGCVVHARDLGETVQVAQAPEDHPLALAVRLALKALALERAPDWTIQVTSTIPVAGGMGSGAAVSTALIRALLRQAGQEPDPECLSRLVYQVERIHHGTPSGIDNTVIAYEQPIWFVRGQPPEPFDPVRPFTLVVADSGIPSPTRETVAHVRQRWQQEPEHYEALFNAIGEIVYAARGAMETGQIEALGPLMDRNQALLRRLGVSASALERLLEAARAAGALGAKLSGGGRGGNVVALVYPEEAARVRAALERAGARRTLVTTVGRGASPGGPIPPDPAP